MSNVSQHSSNKSRNSIEKLVSKMPVSNIDQLIFQIESRKVEVECHIIKAERDIYVNEPNIAGYQ